MIITTFVEIFSKDGTFVGRDTFLLNPKSQEDFRTLVAEQFTNELTNGEFVRAAAYMNSSEIEPILITKPIEIQDN